MRTTTLHSFALSIASLLLAQAPANAFKPEFHDQITQKALSELRHTRSDGTTVLKFQAEAKDAISSANRLTDLDQVSEGKHCDNSQLSGCRALMEEMRQKAINTLNTPGPIAAMAARKHIGIALHALQDYYSHSTEVQPVLASGSGDCENGDRSTGRLASGYFSLSGFVGVDLDIRIWLQQRRCLHGQGNWNGINQDTDDRPYYLRAAGAAKDVSREFVASVIAGLPAPIRDDRACQLMGYSDCLPVITMAISSQGQGTFKQTFRVITHPDTPLTICEYSATSESSGSTLRLGPADGVITGSITVTFTRTSASGPLNCADTFAPSYSYEIPVKVFGYTVSASSVAVQATNGNAPPVNLSFKGTIDPNTFQLVGTIQTSSDFTLLVQTAPTVRIEIQNVGSSSATLRGTPN